MNRCTKLAVAVLAFAYAASPASGQGLSAFVTAGPNIPVGDFSDIADVGWIAGAGVLMPIGQAGLWVGAEGMYGRNSIANLGIDENWTLAGAGGLIGYTITPLQRLSPFIFGSLGFLSWGGTGGIETDNGISFGAGGGVTYGMTQTVNVFGAARFINGRFDLEGETVNLRFIPITVGLNFALGAR
jgi:hypothetical protein